MHIGQAIIAALKAVREADVVHAEQMEDGRVQVVNVNGVYNNVVAEVVGFAVDVAALYTRAGQPDAVAQCRLAMRMAPTAFEVVLCCIPTGCLRGRV
jgi:hypothetical protein